MPRKPKKAEPEPDAEENIYVYIQLPPALNQLWQGRYWEHAQNQVARVYERLNRLHYVLESHPYLSGLLTDEHIRLLRIVAGGINQVDVELSDPATAKPWAVRISSDSWIPVNHIVWGSTAAEARERRIVDVLGGGLKKFAVDKM